MSENKKHILLRVAVGIGSFVMWIFSFKAVRDWLWKKAESKGKEKIIDAREKFEEKKGFLK